MGLRQWMPIRSPFAASAIRMARKPRAIARPRRSLAPNAERVEERALLATGFADFPVPTADSHPYGIALGSDDRIWFTEQTGAQIGVIDPTTHEIQEYKILTPARPSASDITTGPDGNLWFVEWDGVGIFSPSSRSLVATIPITQTIPQGITVGPDHAVWLTLPQVGEILRIDAATHATTAFSVPGHPEEITSGPDDNLYMTDDGLNAMGSPTRNGVVEFNLSTHSASAFTQQTSTDESGGIARGPDGNIWFTETALPVPGVVGTSNIAKLNLATKQITEFGIAVRNNPHFPGMLNDPRWINSGPDGNLWFTDFVAGIGSINPQTGLISESTLNTTSQPVQIVTGPDGNLWFTDQATNAIGEAIPGGSSSGGSGGSTPPPVVDGPPQLAGEQPVFAGTRARRHLAGFELDFNKALDATSATRASNYIIKELIRGGRRPITATIRVAASYDASSHHVTLTLGSRVAFALGGTLTVIGAAPSGITDAAGTRFDGQDNGVPGSNAVLSISRQARSLAKSS